MPFPRPVGASAHILYSFVALWAYARIIARVHSLRPPDPMAHSYATAADGELRNAKDPDGLTSAMKERFPSSGLLLALERGAKANVKN